MESRQEISTSIAQNVNVSMPVPSLKEILREDSELVEFFQFINKEGCREKAHQMILDRISKQRKS